MFQKLTNPKDTNTEPVADVMTMTKKIVQPEGDKPTDHRREEMEDPNVIKINSIGRDDEEGENTASHRADQPDI